MNLCVGSVNGLQGPQSCSLVMEYPGPSSPKILSPENFSPVSGKALDGWDGLLGCLHPCLPLSRPTIYPDPNVNIGQHHRAVGRRVVRESLEVRQ